VIELLCLEYRQPTVRLQCCNDEVPLRCGVERRRRGRSAGGYEFVDKSNEEVLVILAEGLEGGSR
jgi:hypothetical protein